MSLNTTEYYDNSKNGTVDIRYHYFKLINHEFRSLQLDPDLRSKSLFDLIDYCELLYEKSVNSRGEEGVKFYIRGYLIFNYFINSFIMLHFRGFDAFLESNEQDFIIYLNIFAFYTTNDYVRENKYEVSLRSIRKWVIEYLDQKDLIKFDYDSLYQWLIEYIDYLKHKREQDAEEAYRKHTSARETVIDNAGANDSNELINGDDLSIDNFVNRFPSIKDSEKDEQHNTTGIQESTVTGSYPLENTIAPTDPHNQLTKRFSELDVTNKDSKKTPYPVGQVIPLVEDTHTPYPLTEKIEDHQNEDEQFNNSFRNPLNHKVSGLNSKRNGLPNSGLRHAVTVTSINSLENGQYRHSLLPVNGSSHQSIINGQQRFINGPVISNNEGFDIPQRPQNGNYGSQMSSTQRIGQNHQSYSVPEFTTTQKQRVIDKNNKMKCMSQYSICGLKNFGSSCYINSTIQLLFGIELLKNLIENINYKNYVKDPKFLRYLEVSNRNRDNLLLCEALSGLLKVFDTHGSASIAPTRFLRIVSLLKPDFHVPHQQQDAQEFLLFVLERLHEEMSVKIPNGSLLTTDFLENYISKWDINVKPKDKENYIKWYKSLLETEGNSPIHDLFQGHLQNKLVCYKCGYQSVTYSPFTILSLPIPPTHNGIVNLSDCLSYYTQDEILSGENAWNCPKCSKETESSSVPPQTSSLDNHPVFHNKKSGFRFSRRNKSPSKDKSKKTDSTAYKQESVSIKSLNFIKLPRILLVHLSRFSRFNMTDKLNTNIRYPLQLKFNNEEHYISYKLSGIINHYGNLSSGHYTALINKSICVDKVNSLENLYDPYWCLFDDENVRVNLPHGSLHSSSSQDINSRDVYVLCYEIIL